MYSSLKYPSSAYPPVLDPKRKKTCVSCDEYLSGNNFVHAYDHIRIKCYSRRRLTMEKVIQGWVMAQTKALEEGKLPESGVKDLADAMVQLNAFLGNVQKAPPVPVRD